MRNMPVPMSKDDLLMVLRDIVALVEDDDSFEGSLEYMMPEPPPDHEVDLKQTQIIPGGGLDRGGIQYSCTVCGLAATDDLDALTAMHLGDPVTTAAGERTQFMVMAAYRIGNSMGQGGMRMVGELR